MNASDQPPAADNPFSTCRTRPGAIPYVFPPGQSAAALIERMRESGWRGQIVGPHGSGKSALLATLAPAIEASGRPAVMRLALESVRPRGGTAVVIGNARHGEQVQIDPWQLNQGKRLLGTWGGDSQPDRDFPRYCALIQAGRLLLQPLLNRRYPLEAINRALDDLESGATVRPLIEMGVG